VLSDTHLRPWSHRTYRRIARAAERARESGATQVLLAGDILEDDREADVVARRLRRALGPLPALYVTGNHELRGEDLRGAARRNDPARIHRALAAHGIEPVDDRIVDVDGLPLLGIGWRGRRSAGPEVSRDLEAAGRALVLAHSPDQIVGLPPAHVIIALCGHTHGGQVRLPLIGAPWVPVRSALPRLAGRMRIAGVPTYVSRGIGATIPVRLGAVPEAILLELVPGTR
jgi:hypothetical protein